MGLGVGLILLLPTAAQAWQKHASFETRIHGHAFSKVTIESRAECQLRVRIDFEAPELGYKHESPARNFYRFHVRAKLDDGRGIVTRPFSNSAPGARAYTYLLDTSGEGCWSKAEHRITAIDVEGCRGAGCTPEPFK
jgi:hypothetical protein